MSSSMSLIFSPNLSLLQSLLLLLGALTLARPLLSLLLVLHSLFLARGVPLRSYSSKAPRALVTGASDGIGAEFARQLAGKGFEVTLVGRSREKLQKVADEIAKASPTAKLSQIILDFSSPSHAGWSDLSRSVTEGTPIGVLVNNVGVSHAMPVPFAQSEMQENEAIVAVNVASLVRVTHMVLPGMQERKSGLILNLGSFAGQFATPLLSTYSASKSFLLTFSKCLGAEQANARTGVRVACLNTYFVVSAMSGIRRSNWLVPTPKAYVGKVLKSIGTSGGAGSRPYSATLWPGHALADWAISNLLPSENWLLNYQYTSSLDVRKRALRKAERLAKAQ